MSLYEHVVLTRQDLSGQQNDELIKTYTGVLEGLGGSVAKTEYWGLKTIAYKIRKNRKAHYTLLNLDAPSDAVHEMERQMRIDENVLRFMTIRVDELQEGPSAMMQKRDRDDRRRGGDRGDRGERGGDRGARGAGSSVRGGGRGRGGGAREPATGGG